MGGPDDRLRDTLWSAIHHERAALRDDLVALDEEAWATSSLCHAWTVEEIVAHLTVRPRGGW